MRTVAVVLAAGKNERLAPVVPPFHKPLLVYEGETLVGRAARLASTITDEVIVVVAPQNAAPIAEVVTEGTLIVQRQPTGPVDALCLARPYVGPDDSVLLMMGDNTFEIQDLLEVMDAEGDFAVGVRYEADLRKQRQLQQLNDGSWWCGPVRARSPWASGLVSCDALELPLGEVVRRWCVHTVPVTCRDLGRIEDLP